MARRWTTSLIPLPDVQPHDAPDDALIDAARSGDRRAFESLYRAHVGGVYATCLRLTAHVQSAEDLTQEAFVRAWQRLASIPRRQCAGDVAASADGQCRVRSAAQTKAVAPATAAIDAGVEALPHTARGFEQQRSTADLEAAIRALAAGRADGIRAARRRRLAARRDRRAQRHRHRHQQSASASGARHFEGVAVAMNEHDMTTRWGESDSTR